MQVGHMDAKCADFPVNGVIEAGAWARLPQNPPLGKMFDGIMQVPHRDHFGPRRGSASALNLCSGH